MPRGGSLTLADIADERIVLTCDKCDRRGSYSVARLWRERGDIKMTDWLTEVSADCPRRQAGRFNDWCGVRRAT
jgi:hypothetical protein